MTELLPFLPFLFPFFGLFVGSFLNVVILRLHSGEKGIATGKSHCVSCKHPLQSLDLIPIFSWLFLRGKCRYCRASISVQYPLVEAANSAVWLGAFFAAESVFQAIFFSVLGSILLALFVIDARFYELPDELSIPAIVMVVAVLALGVSWLPNWPDAFIGAAIPTIFFGAQWVFSRGAWIGDGDLRLGILMGLLLGWQKTLVALFLAYILGAIIGVFAIAMGKKTGGSMLPFGPFLILGTVIAFFWGNKIISWYLHLS